MTPLGHDVLFDLSQKILRAAEQDEDPRAIIQVTVSELIGLG